MASIPPSAFARWWPIPRSSSSDLAQMTLDRRAFLKLAALAPFAGTANLSWAAASPARKLLVLVELKGGNDGLNMVIPYADPEYARIRPGLAIARDQVVQLS